MSRTRRQLGCILISIVSWSIADKVVADQSVLPTIASINVCADQLLLALADHSQIASLSYLSHDSNASHFFELAQSFTTNRGRPEEIIPFNPDVVIVGQYSDKYTVQLLKQVGLEVKTLPIANSMKDVFSNIQMMADWVGRPEAGKQMLINLKSRIDKLEPVSQTKPTVAIYDPNGYTAGTKSLRGNMLRLAGWHNVATDVGIESFGALSLETMVKLRPDAIVESPYSEGTWSHAQAIKKHPALAQRGIDATVITLQSKDVICGGPWSVKLTEQLMHARIQHQAR